MIYRDQTEALQAARELVEFRLHLDETDEPW